MLKAIGNIGIPAVICLYIAHMQLKELIFVLYSIMGEFVKINETRGTI